MSPVQHRQWGIDPDAETTGESLSRRWEEILARMETRIIGTFMTDEEIRRDKARERARRAIHGRTALR